MRLRAESLNASFLIDSLLCSYHVWFHCAEGTSYEEAGWIWGFCVIPTADVRVHSRDERGLPEFLGVMTK